MMMMVETHSQHDRDNNRNGNIEEPGTVCNHVNSDVRAHRRGYCIRGSATVGAVVVWSSDTVNR